MKIGYIGLGKMGMGQVLRLLEKKHEVVVWNRSPEPRAEAAKHGAVAAETIEELVSKLEAPRTVWLMVPHAVVDEMLAKVLPLLSPGDTIIDGGNSPYVKTVERAKMIWAKKIHFLDAGVSGGPSGARNGACIMVGGEKKDFERYLPLWKDLSCPDGFLYAGTHGAGHYVKMVHNGIEYGMMQAIGEGFEVLKRSQFDLDLEAVANLYNHQSVITSRLVGWLANAYKNHGQDLADISGEVNASGEGQWTVEDAKRLGVAVPVIEASLKFRTDSKGNPSYTGQVVSALRNQFGGHDVAKS